MLYIFYIIHNFTIPYEILNYVTLEGRAEVLSSSVTVAKARKHDFANTSIVSCTDLI